ncbi:MAG: hypothetical protein FWD01_00245 [Defluviitaleaceae bacterium]|nr:hypothetical protein [Defluviitaleaceae bacterium]
MDYQEIAGRITENYELTKKAYPRFLDLVSEIGELGKELLEGSDYGDRDFELDDIELIEMELGDVIFALACLANTLGIDMESAFSTATSKYTARFENFGRVGTRS